MPDQTETPTLIQRRMALSRGLTYPIVAIAVTAFNLVFQIVTLAESSGSSGWNWIAAGTWTILLVVGVLSLFKAMRSIAAFEREYGRDAGKQKPVGRP